MSIAEQEKELFAEWEADKTLFVRDGVVSEQAYRGSKTKVVFVLMEYAHERDKSKKFDLRENELQEPWGPGWFKAAKILHGINMLSVPPEQQKPYRKAMKMPQNICAFNLDKSGGHPENDMARLALAAMKDKDFIRRQFKIYEPDVTLCCGTFKIFRAVLGHEHFEVNKTKGGVSWYERGDAHSVLGINHTADRGRQPPEEVIAAVKEIQSAKK